MIIPEQIMIDNKEYLKQYSDRGYMLQEVGTDKFYSEAVDLIGCVREYVETDILIEENIEFSDGEYHL